MTSDSLFTSECVRVRYYRPTGQAECGQIESGGVSDSTAWPEKRPSEWTQGERDRVRLLVYGGAPAPLDRTRLGMAIAETVPEANQRVTMNEWRKDLKRRVAERIAQRRRASQVCVVCDHGSRYPCEVCDPRGFALWLAERHL